MTDPTDPTIVIADGTDVAAAAAARVTDLEARLAALATERDTLAAGLAEKAQLAEAAVAERDKALGDVQRMTSAAREAAVLDALYVALPHAPRTDVRRVLRAMVVDGKLSTDTDTPDRAAADVISVLQGESSALLRAPVGANGGTSPPLARVAPRRKFLI